MESFVWETKLKLNETGLIYKHRNLIHKVVGDREREWHAVPSFIRRRLLIFLLRIAINHVLGTGDDLQLEIGRWESYSSFKIDCVRARKAGKQPAGLTDVMNDIFLLGKLTCTEMACCILKPLFSKAIGFFKRN